MSEWELERLRRAAIEVPPLPPPRAGPVVVSPFIRFNDFVQQEFAEPCRRFVYGILGEVGARELWRGW